LPVLVERFPCYAIVRKPLGSADLLEQRGPQRARGPFQGGRALRRRAEARAGFHGRSRGPAIAPAVLVIRAVLWHARRVPYYPQRGHR
jgi:hypothetical protein